mgnify:FL=1
MTNKILVVEDEQGLAELLEYFLGELGYDVITAYNGHVALQMLQRRPVELIISDLMMPVKDGYEFVKELKAFPILATIPIMLASGGPISPTRLNPYKAEAYLAKPFDLHELELLVYRLFDIRV